MVFDGISNLRRSELKFRTKYHKVLGLLLVFIGKACCEAELFLWRRPGFSDCGYGLKDVNIVRFRLQKLGGCGSLARKEYWVVVVKSVPYAWRN